MKIKKSLFGKLISILSPFRAFILISGFFLVIFCLLSLVSHYNFFTNAFDLGIFNQTLYQYAHLDLGPNTVRNVQSLLGDHFELLMFLFTPFYWIFGSYTLLIIQIATILFGGLGIYLLLKRETKNEWLTLGGVLIFYLSFGLYQALAYDFHNNVVGIMFVPWLFYFIARKQWKGYYFFLVLFLVSKENMALIGILLGVSMLIFESGKSKWHGLITFLLSSVYFVLVFKFLIPAFNQGGYDHWYYTSLGSGPMQAIGWMLRHPLQAIQLLFDDPKKLETWRLVLFSGGVLAIFKPKYSLLLLPVIAQKFFSDNQNYWTPYFQYSVEFAPIIAIAVIMTLNEFRSIKTRYAFVILFILLNGWVLKQVNFHDQTNIFRLLNKDYYFPDHQRALTLKAMELIPADASVGAQSQLVPHLANRSEIYFFPSAFHLYKFDPKNGPDYVILNLNLDRNWPIENKDAFLKIKNNLLDHNIYYQLIFDQSDVYLYKKIPVVL